MVNATSQAQKVQNSQSPQPSTTPTTTQTHPALLWLQSHHSKIMIIILALQGLWTLSQSLGFIFVDLPKLEQQLTQHTITQNEVNQLANQAIITTISTILSLIFALRLTITQSKIAQAFNKIVGIILIVGNTQLGHVLTQIGSTQLLTTLALNFVRSSFSFLKKLLP